MLQCSFIKIPCNKILITIDLIAQYVLCKDYLYVKFSKKSPRGGYLLASKCNKRQIEILHGIRFRTNSCSNSK